ncbi:MAG: NAD(P)/FAD-dependent oxidoreductase [Acidimicrobiales bacterium]
MASEPGSTTSTNKPGAVRHGQARVVVVGAGFGGLAAAKALADRPWHRSAVQVTVVDQHNFHTFTPFLYQVATALLEPTGAAHPVRSLIRKQSNVEFRLGRVTAINVTRRQVETDRGPIGYDYLVLAGGAVNDYFGNTDISEHSLGLNNLGEALALRNHILSCFEAAAWAADPAERARLLTFAVVGGGPTGVEFSAALAVLVAEMVAHDFPSIDADEPRIVLVEASPTPLSAFAPDLQQAAAKTLRTKGVQVESAAKVADVDGEGLSLEGGQRIAAGTVVWAAGVRANPLAGTLPATGSHGRVIVGPTLQVERHPEVFVIGDMAEIPSGAGPLPMLAQVAIQSGRHPGAQVLRLCAGKDAMAFHYRDLGTMAALGRGDAVAQVGALHLSGLQGWLAWLGLHIVRTVGLQAKATIMADWASGFLFADRPVRLITGPGHDPREGPTHLVGPEPATARVPMARAKVDLPSVNVANANRWGRVAALAWWGQAYPGIKKEPDQPHGLAELRQEAVELRHELTGDKSQTDDDYRG